MPSCRKPTCRLYRARTLTALWAEVLRGWFQKQTAQAWQQPAYAVVLVPHRQWAAVLKARLVEEHKAYAGLAFWTPADFRNRLLARYGGPFRVAPREWTRLLLAIAAAQHPATPSAESVARDPSDLAAALEQAGAGGWSPTDLEWPGLQPVLAHVAATLEATSLSWPYVVDRDLRSGVRQPLIQELLVLGFTGQQWPLWHLLQAAVEASQNATVCLGEPRDTTWNLDGPWIGSWEEAHSVAEPVADAASSAAPCAELAERLELSPQPEDQAGPPPPIEFRVGRDIREQAAAAVMQAMVFMADTMASRVGIVVPSRGALAREIAALLSAQGIPHYDSLGHAAAPPMLLEPWRAWLHMQAEPTLAAGLNFLRLYPQAAAPLGWAAVAQCCDRVFNEVLAPPLPLIAVALRSAAVKDDEIQSLRALERLLLLPDNAAFSDLLRATSDALEKLEWRAAQEMLARVEVPGGAWRAQPCPRHVFLRWLRETTDTFKTAREEIGAHPYARVQLLSYMQAEGPTWSHLVLTGLNENQWPLRERPNPFLPDTRIAALNRRALGQGRQGEGHTVVRAPHTLMLDTAARRSVALRHVINLIENTSVAVAVTNSLVDDTDPARRLAPSEILTRLYYLRHRTPLTDEILDRLRDQTAVWLKTAPPLYTGLRDATAEEDQTVVAYQARRAPGWPFGEYEFAFTNPPSTPLTLSCKDWEQALRSPASYWMKHALGIENTTPDPAQSHYQLALGNWVHRWLSLAGHAGKPGAWKTFPRDGEWLHSVDAAAGGTRRQVEAAYRTAGMTLPEWWIALWEQALGMARGFAAELEQIQGWPWMATEWSLPRNITITLPNGSCMPLRGRMDLLLADSDPQGEAGVNYWVVDYKTGNDSPLQANRLGQQLVKGKGLQICLYALARAHLGAAGVTASLVPLNTRMEPQVQLSDIRDSSLHSFWRELARMQTSGVFGMLEPLRPKYGFTPAHPLATLAIDLDILKEKWALTHPGFRSAEQQDTP